VASLLGLVVAVPGGPAAAACRVTIQDLDGTSHTAEVTASSLFEAVAQGLSALRKNEWVEGIEERFGIVKVSVAEFSLAVSGMNSTASAQNGAPANVQGTWLTAITRINQVGQDFTALMSLSAGGVWQATGANDRLNGGVSPLYGSWQRISENRYSSKAYFFAFDPSGNPVVLLRVDEIFNLKNQNQLEGVGEGYVCSLQGKGQDCVRTPEVDITFTAERVVPPSQ